MRVDVHRVDAIGGGLAQMIERAVAGDPVKPGPRVDRPVVGEDRGVRRREHLLEHVLGVLRRADQVPAERQQPRLVAVEENFEGAVVALADQGDQLLVWLQAQQRRSPCEDAGGTSRCEGGGFHYSLYRKNTLQT